jgi:hypothetical protein
MVIEGTNYADSGEGALKRMVQRFAVVCRIDIFAVFPQKGKSITLRNGLHSSIDRLDEVGAPELLASHRNL